MAQVIRPKIITVDTNLMRLNLANSLYTLLSENEIRNPMRVLEEFKTSMDILNEADQMCIKAGDINLG